ncbi:Carbamoylphosphate synthase large subunit protein [Minicystis rosea]|nr:Carbamoylphosphate synthase large subunit protein [Minicystis rosea]
MKQSDLLRTKIRLVSARLDALTSSLWLHPNLRASMPEVLVILHQVAGASVPLLEVALSEARARVGDQAAAPLADYLERHIPEEVGHDAWFLDDLEALGVHRRAVVSRIASPSIARLVGAQYYWVRHAHPVAVLGYLAAIEGNPPTVDGIEGIMSRTGLPRAAFRTWLHHARLDPDHLADLHAVIDDMALDPSRTSLVSVSALHTVHALESVFQDLLDHAGQEG